MSKPAIVLSGHTMGLGVVRALGINGIPVIVMHYDVRDMAHVSRYVERNIQVPHPEKHEAQFVEVLIGYAKQYGGSLLVPASDETLATVSRHKAELSRYYVVACPDWPVTEMFIDKSRTYALADKLGVPAPKTLVPLSREDVEDYGRAVDFPCLVKPCQSHLFYDRFKTKMVRVENLDQMLRAYQQAADADLGVVLQEIIPGDESSGAVYNTYFWDGEPLVEFTGQKIRSAPPSFGSPRVNLSKHIPELLEPGRRILKAMAFYGFSCSEFKRDARDGVYKLIEVNGRHNLSGTLALRCGINFPWMEYRHLIQGKKPVRQEFEDGIYWIDLMRDIGYSAMYFRKEEFSLGDYLRPYFKPHVFAILDWKDPRPFIQRVSFLFKSAAQTVAFGTRQDQPVPPPR